MTAGKQGCPCLNSTATLESLAARTCTVPTTGDAGVYLTLGGTCVSASYGALQCLQHDLLHDITCQSGNTSEVIPPPYCYKPWVRRAWCPRAHLTRCAPSHLTRALLMMLHVQCYVNATTCARESTERFFRSSYFDFDSGVNLYYSYTTCNATAQDWLNVADDVVAHSGLGGSKSKYDAPVGIVGKRLHLTCNHLASPQSPSTPMCPPITSPVST